VKKIKDDMQIQIDFWQLLLALAALIGSFASVVWAFGATLVRQFEIRLDERFAAIDEARKNTGGLLQNQLNQIQDMERSILQFKADMPIHYVRRDDYIRGQTVIESKIDAVMSRLEMVQIQVARHGN
jgi:hypothetical protein